MIIQIPHGTSIVLRFDGADADGSDVGQTLTLLSGSPPGAAVTSTAGQLTAPAIPVRRRTMLLCAATGMLVAGIGGSILQSPRAEPVLYQPHLTAWNDSSPGTPGRMPERMQAELDRGPTIVPPDSGPVPAPGLGQPTGAPPSNPFGLE